MTYSMLEGHNRDIHRPFLCKRDNSPFSCNRDFFFQLPHFASDELGFTSAASKGGQRSPHCPVFPLVSQSSPVLVWEWRSALSWGPGGPLRVMWPQHPVHSFQGRRPFPDLRDQHCRPQLEPFLKVSLIPAAHALSTWSLSEMQWFLWN